MIRRPYTAIGVRRSREDDEVVAQYLVVRRKIERAAAEAKAYINGKEV